MLKLDHWLLARVALISFIDFWLFWWANVLYRVISGGGDGRVRVWSVTSSHQAMATSWKEHRGPVTCIQVNMSMASTRICVDDETFEAWPYLISPSTEPTLQGKVLRTPKFLRTQEHHEFLTNHASHQ